jgi:hypothetical protein
MACKECGDTTYPDGTRCFDCASKKVDEWREQQNQPKAPIEERMARERRPMKRVKPDEDQGQLV